MGSVKKNDFIKYDGEIYVVCEVYEDGVVKAFNVETDAYEYIYPDEVGEVLPY